MPTACTSHLQLFHKHLILQRFGPALVALVVTTAIASCAGANTGAVSNEITGSVDEWAINVSATEANAGEVSFSIENTGTIVHEFMVLKTDLGVGEIPFSSSETTVGEMAGHDMGGHETESIDGAEFIGHIQEIAVGTTESLTLKLEAGNYQLVCNLPGHYQSGMSLAFKVG